MACALAAQAAHIVYQQNIPADLVAVDPSGNVYTAGSSTVTKLDPQGNIIYSKQPRLTGDWNGIAVSAAGELVIVGTTYSDALPGTPGVFQPNRNSNGHCISGDRLAQPVPCSDAFVAKLDAAGNVAWATYLGGSSNEDGYSAAIDAGGNIYVAGLTESSDFYSVSAFQAGFGGYADGFITKISADGTHILYSSFMGGPGYDFARGVAVDGEGNAYLTGAAEGPGLPVTPGSFGHTCDDQSTEAFLLKVAPAGDHLIFGGCLGSAGSYSQANAVAVDSQNEAFFGGTDIRATFPSTPGAFQSLTNPPYGSFLTKVSADGSQLVYSAVFDGGSFGVSSIAVDSAGDAYATSDSFSASLPIIGPALQPCAGSNGPAVLFELNPSGSAATYFSYDDGVGRLALDSEGALYEASGRLLKITQLDVPADSYLSSQCVLNGASFQSHVAYDQPGISPGEIVTLKGARLGPLAPPPVAYGLPPQTQLAGVQVFFDGTPAPLLYVQDHQLNVIAPYEIAGKTQTTIQVQYNDQMTTPVTIPVSDTSAAVFENGAGAPLVFNQDFSLNGPANPVAPGGAIVLFITGGGQTSPPSRDGQIWETLGVLQAPVSALLQGVGENFVNTPATVLYAGPAPTEVSGVQQLNFLIPPVQDASGMWFLQVNVGAQIINLPLALR